MIRRITQQHAALALIATLVFSTTAFAGPLLVCHGYDIGDAKSLPWDESYVWSASKPTYDLSRLVADTEAILMPATPIVVRMETLRRAAIYASHDRAIATTLRDRLLARVDASRRSGRADTSALVDAAYLMATFHQIALMAPDRDFRTRAANVNGLSDRERAHALIKEAVQQHPEQPAIEFAAALVTFGWDRAAYVQFAHDTRMTAPRDALVAKNVALLPDWK